MAEIIEIFGGFPGGASRGYLGWSSCYLIRADDGATFLFDCGGPGDRGQLEIRLRQNQVDPKTLTGVVLSHFHYDHAANWDLFPNAVFYIHEREVAYVKSGQAENDHGLLRHNFRTLARSVELSVVQDEQHDIGAMTLLHMPGHTPGSMVLQLDRGLLCSDALKHRWDIDRQEVSLPVWDPGAARSSIDRIASADVDTLYPGHDAPLTRVGGIWSATRAPTETIGLANGESRLVTL